MVSDILIPIITAAVGYYGAYIGGKKTLEATKLSIKNEENQNRTVLMSIISHMVILIENNNDKKNNDGSKGTPLCNTFVKFKAYEKIWSLLPKSGLSVNEIKIIYIFNMQLEDAYEYYQHVSKVHNDDRIKTEWNLSVNLADQSNTTMLIKFTKNNIVEIKNVIEKYFSDVKYGIS